MSDTIDAVSELLDGLSDGVSARRLMKQVHPLRGVRGVPMGEVARVTAAAWQEEPTALPRDADALSHLFSTAFEDGLVAIGLLAACLPDTPDAALDLGLDWAGRVDDVLTADALGWLVLGPAALAAGADLVDELAPLRGSSVDAIRRIAVTATLAALPVAVEGPSAAAIRARLGTKRVQWVDAPQSHVVAKVASAVVRDEGPAVRKALRRVLREWAKADPVAMASWGEGVRGGLPKILGDEVKKAARKAARLEKESS